jgi:DNA helicase-2/ATP-dependent DNA helicase PcrA
VYDEQDSKSLLKSIVKELNIDEKRFPVSMFSRSIDQAKNKLITPAEMLEKGDNYGGRLQGEVYDRYQRDLLKANAMDFGDLLFNVVVLFQRFPEILALYQSALHFVLVDEFQDTNKVQYTFLEAITRTRRNLLVVGDEDQSIYAFRGATIRNILEFERDFKDSVVVKLEQNYRSTATILNVAQAVIENNKTRKGKKLWTAGEKGEPITGYLGDDEGDEAQFVAFEISKLQKKGINLEDIAIFYRTNAQSRALEEALMNLKIPYRIFGGLKFYERKEIKDIVGYLRLIVNEADAQAFLRVVNTPPRGIGAQTIQNVSNLARDRGLSLFGAAELLADKSKGIAQFVELIHTLRTEAITSSLGDLIRSVLEKTEYWARLKLLKDPSTESRLENLRELEAIGAAEAGKGETPAESLRLFLDRISLTSGGDIPEEAAREAAGEEPHKIPMVSLMTLHLAKGLEFPYVFFTGLEEGLLPHYRSIDVPSEVEEERRLCYVGITRAMKKLYVTRAVQRGMFSAGEGFGLGGLYRQPSRFIKEMPEEFIESRGHGDFIGGVSAREEEDLFFDDSTEYRGAGRELDSRKGSRLRGSIEQPRRPRSSGFNFVVSADSLGTAKTPEVDHTRNLSPAAANELSPGLRVVHPKFGRGVIEHLDGDLSGNGDNVKITVRFDDSAQTKKLLFRQARLARENH